MADGFDLNPRQMDARRAVAQASGSFRAELMTPKPEALIPQPQSLNPKP